MSSQLAKTADNSPLVAMAQRFGSEPTKLFDTLKATVFKDARNNEELMALVIVSNQYGLNPLTKEIYAFPAKGGGIVPVVSVDGWLRMMNDHPQFDGIAYEWEHDGAKLVSCTAVIHRKDRKYPTRLTEYLSECQRNTDPWKMQHRMLRHKATIQCARVAFGFSGIVDEDDAPFSRGLGGERDVTPVAQAAESKLFAAVPVQDEVEVVRSPQSETLLDVPAVPLVEQVHALIKSTNVSWRVASEIMHKNGILAEDYAAPEDAKEDELREVIGAWVPMVKIAQRGGAK